MTTNVLMSFIHFPMAIARYLESAFERRGDVDLMTVGPYTKSFIPWGGGMHLPARYAKAPDLALNNSGRLIPRVTPIQFVERLLERERPGWEPDLVIQIDAGYHLVGKPRVGKNIIVATDPHALNYDSQRRLADTFYSMQSVYRKPGDLLLPYACCPVYHAALEEQDEYDFDAALVGLQYSHRTDWVRTLRAQGVRVRYELGSAFDEARAAYASAPIGLNWSSAYDLNARVFELLGMRRVAVVNQVPALGEFFKDNKHLLTFSGQRDSVAPVKWAMAHPEEAQAIAAAGHAECMAYHTWDHRVDQLIRGLDYPVYQEETCDKPRPKERKSA